MRPNKSDVLDYLDGKAVTAAPPRFAHVMISNTTTNEPYYQDLLVGPLPVDNKTTRWQPLTYPYTKKGGEGKVRDILADSEQVYLQWLIPIGLSLANVTKDLWNITLLGANNAPNILPIAADPLWQDDGRGEAVGTSSTARPRTSSTPARCCRWGCSCCRTSRAATPPSGPSTAGCTTTSSMSPRTPS